MRKLVAALVIMTVPVCGQETIPAPGDYAGALQQAQGLYTEAIELVNEGRDASQEDDFAAFDIAVRRYRRVMSLLMVWHGRGVLGGRLQKEEWRLRTGCRASAGSCLSHAGSDGRGTGWMEHGEGCHENPGRHGVIPRDEHR